MQTLRTVLANGLQRSLQIDVVLGNLEPRDRCGRAGEPLGKPVKWDESSSRTSRIPQSLDDHVKFAKPFYSFYSVWLNMTQWTQRWQQNYWATVLVEKTYTYFWIQAWALLIIRKLATSVLIEASLVSIQNPRKQQTNLFALHQTTTIHDWSQAKPKLLEWFRIKNTDQERLLNAVSLFRAKSSLGSEYSKIASNNSNHDSLLLTMHVCCTSLKSLGWITKPRNISWDVKWCNCHLPPQVHASSAQSLQRQQWRMWVLLQFRAYKSWHLLLIPTNGVSCTQIKALYIGITKCFKPSESHPVSQTRIKCNTILYYTVYDMQHARFI